MFMWLRRIFLITIFLGIVTNVNPAFPPVNFTEEDGSPSVYPVKVEVSDGTLTDDGSATISIDTSGVSTTGWTRSAPSIYTTTITDNVGIGTTLPLGLLQVGTSPNPYLIVTTAGNVGIGTTAPNSLLDVGGFNTISVLGSNGRIVGITGNVNTFAGVEMYNANAGNGAEFRFTIADETQDDYLAFSMPSTGNTNTLFGLTRGTAAYLFSNANTGGRILAVGTVTNHNMVFGTNNTERIRILNSGNVGIGTTNPLQELEVKGDIDLRGDADPHLQFAPASGDAFEFYAYGSELYATNVTDSKVLWRITPSNQIQFYNQAGFVFPDGAPSDNQILKYDLALGRLAWEADNKVIAQFTITNGDTAIDATVTDPVACVRIPNNSIITGWYLDANASGSIVLDVWKNTWDDTAEVNGDSIAGTEKPTLSTDVSASDTSLTSMTTDWNANDNVCIEIESASTITKARLQFVGYCD